MRPTGGGGVSGRRVPMLLLLAVAGGLFTPRSAVLFDGVGQPDEPYRYVAPPAGYPATKPVRGAQVRVPLRAGRSQDYVQLRTDENGPQLQLALTAGSVTGSGSGAVVTAVPAAPQGPVLGQSVDGNVYVLRVTAGQLATASVPATIDLRAPTSGTYDRIAYRPAPGQPWRALDTSLVGADIWEALLQGSGEYALANQPLTRSSAGRAPRRSGARARPVAVSLAAAAVLLAAVLVLLRRRARR